MVVTAEQLSATIGEIYAAPGNPAGFNPALRRIRTLLNASSGMLFTPLVDPGNGGFGFVDHFNTDFFARYRAYYWDKDPWAREGERKGLMRARNTVTDQSLISQHELQKEEIFADLLAPMDTTRICCSVIAVDDDAVIPRTYLSLYRGARSRPFKEEERRVLDLLGPHIGQALRLSYRLDFADTSRGTAYDVLHELAGGVILVDREKHIVFMNRQAEMLCSAKHRACAALTTNGALRATRPAHDVVLQQAIDAAVRPSASTEGRKAQPDSIAIRASDGNNTLMVTVVSLPLAMQPANGPRARAVVFIDDPASGRSADERSLRALFGLTAAECRVAKALVAGDQPKRIAENLALSENTIRTQIKAIYAKTGTHGMAGLVALLSRTSGMRAAPAE